MLHYLDTETLIGLNAGLHRYPWVLCLLLSGVCSQPSGCWVLSSTSHWIDSLEKRTQSSLPTGSPPPLMVDGQSTKDFYVSIRAHLVPGSGVNESITPVKSQAECAAVLPAAAMLLSCLHLGLCQGWRLGWGRSQAPKNLLLPLPPYSPSHSP